MKWTKLLGFLGLLMLPILLLAGLAGAQSFRTGDTTTVASDEVIDSSLYAFGRNVDIAGTVNGDVFCGAQNVTISGEVDGDVMCAGQTVNITGAVSGDVRTAGQTVSISGSVDGSLSAAGQSVTLTDESEVGRDVGVAGDSLTLSGIVGRDVSAGATSVSLSSEVGRDVRANTEGLTVSRDARIGGNVTYDSINEALIADEAQIAGAITYNPKTQAQTESKGSYLQVLGFGLTFGIFIILSMLVMSLALILLFPSLIHQTAKRALADPLKTFLTGLLASIAAPVLIIAVMMTGVGFPLGILLLFVWIVIMLLTGPFASYMLGRFMLGKQTNPVLIMLAGSAVVMVSYLIPIIGFIVLLAVMWFGTGMIIREAYHRIPKPKYDLK